MTNDAAIQRLQELRHEMEMIKSHLNEEHEVTKRKLKPAQLLKLPPIQEIADEFKTGHAELLSRPLIVETSFTATVSIKFNADDYCHYSVYNTDLEEFDFDPADTDYSLTKVRTSNFPFWDGDEFIDYRPFQYNDIVELRNALPPYAERIDFVNSIANRIFTVLSREFPELIESEQEHCLEEATLSLIKNLWKKYNKELRT
jgi:hypothetical protein